MRFFEAGCSFSCREGGREDGWKCWCRELASSVASSMAWHAPCFYGRCVRVGKLWRLWGMDLLGRRKKSWSGPLRGKD